MGKDEIGILFEYANGSIHSLHPGDKGLVERIVRSISSIRPFEHPDIIIPLDDKVLAIEHFQFDASSTIRNGSTDKRKLAERNRDFDRVIRDQFTGEEPIVRTNSVDCLYSSSNYLKNFKSSFKGHYEKISRYKENLVNKGIVKHAEDILMGFFIIDSTPLGCYYIEEGLPKSFCLFQVTDYLELISASNEVDCVFAGFFDGSNNFLTFMSNTKEAIESVRNLKLIDFGIEEFFTFNPQETRFCTKVTSND